MIILTGVYLIRPPLFHFINTARLREMHTAFALLIVVSIAVVMNAVGLSPPALGTFLAGVVLANSEFRHELESDIQPFKGGLLLGLFFITVGGAGMNVSAFLAAPPGELLSLALTLMALKGAVLFALGKLFGLKGGRDIWLFTLGLAQAGGEFGFVLTSFGLQQGVVQASMANGLLMVITLSMLLTPLFFIFHDILSKYLVEHRTSAPPHDEIDETHSVIIIGAGGRFGQVVNRLVRSAGFDTTVLDNNLSRIKQLRRLGVKSFYGDPTRPELLNAAGGLATAKVLVVTVNTPPEAATRIVRHARQARPDLHIVVRAAGRTHVYELYKAGGANDIVRELFDSSCGPDAMCWRTSACPISRPARSSACSSNTTATRSANWRICGTQTRRWRRTRFMCRGRWNWRRTWKPPF